MGRSIAAVRWRGGTDTKILYDSDFVKAAGLVETATLTGLADGAGIVSDQDLVIV